MGYTPGPTARGLGLATSALLALAVGGVPATTATAAPDARSAAAEGATTAVSTIDGHYGFIGYSNTTFQTGSGTVVVTVSSHPGAQMRVTA